jgi:hypothetical protein
VTKRSEGTARHRVKHDSPIKAREKGEIENTHDLFGQLVKELTDEEGQTVRRYRDYLLSPDPDRNWLLTTHIIVERLIESILETRLSSPDVWIPTADFSSKVRLARALGLIGEEQHRVCSVLHNARNALAHKLEPLANKWRVELNRLAYGRRRKPANDQNDFSNMAIELISIVFASCLRARFYHKRLQLKHQYSDRWLEVMKQKLHETLTSPIETADGLDEELLKLEVDLQIARESKQAKNKNYDS